ncbi:MAG: hypothetical protein Q9181_004399 [Wetmoreana brouardii]
MLAPEIRNTIYKFACGNMTIHVQGKGVRISRISSLFNTICLETEMYQTMYAEGSAVSNPAAYYDRAPNSPLEVCHRDHAKHPRFTIGSLLVCRQFYWEIRPIILSTNTIYIDCYGTLERFYRSVPSYLHVYLRNLTLHMDVSTKRTQVAWERIIGKDLIRMNRSFDLENLEIILIQDHREVVPEYQTPHTGWLTNLCALGSLCDPTCSWTKTLPNLKTCKITLTDHKWIGDKRAGLGAGRNRVVGSVEKLWTHEQKLEWAKFFHKCITASVPKEPMPHYMDNPNMCW